MTTATTDNTFSAHCRDAVLSLRGALLELYQEAGADVAKPQDVARTFKLNKNLTWKIARILQSEDAFSVVPLIPGAAGFEILLEAMGRAGASEDSIVRVREAAQGFDRMIETHTGDRATLELLLDSQGAGKPLEISRKLAHRGSSGIWGIQADVRVTTQFLAPNRDDPALLDAALVGGFTRVRRLRDIPRWPVFQLMRYNDDGSKASDAQAIAIDDADKENNWLLSKFCDGVLPEFHIVESDRGVTYEIGEGPVGRTGEFSCFFGYSERAVLPRYRDPHNRLGELFSTVSVPSETLLFDLIVHRDLEEISIPTVELHGRLWGEVGGSAAFSRLPCADKAIDLGVGAPVSTPLVPRYAELVRTVQASAGWNPKDFRCLRLMMTYPPMPSTVLMRYELPERAG